jgi:O-succinylbenzoate synthase
MFVERAELHVVELPLRFRFETSFGATTSRTVPLLVLHAGGAVGLGEGVMDAELPLYREETVAGALPLLRHLLSEHVVGRELPYPESFSTAVQHLRGNRMTKAIVETALWDLHARQAGVPLRELLGGERTEVPCGISLGIQPSIDDTIAAVERNVEAGYRRIKLKIKPGWDVDVLTAVREAFPSIVLTADANSAYTLDDADHLRRLDALHLDYIEQPLGWEDLIDHSQLRRCITTPICLDESVVDAATARHAVAIGAAQVINLKLARVGGYGEARLIDVLASTSGVPLWCGGMLETGVGRAHNIHLATLHGFTKPGDTSSASRYWEADVVNEPLEAADGLMAVPSGTGIGVTLAYDVIGRHEVLQEVFRA